MSLHRKLAFCAHTLALGMLAAIMATPAHAQDEIFRDKFISLGTSSRSGTFHLVGSQICDAVNEDRKKNLVRCVTYNTVGSEYNAKAVAYGELTMGITRPDIAHKVYSSTNDVDAHGDGLRAVMSLHSTPIVMIARRAANITNSSELAGHSINLGNRGSSQRITVELLLKNLGLTPANFSAVTEMHTTQMGEAFCQGKIDVIVESLGNPSPFYKRMIEECNGRIVLLQPALIDKILTANPLMTRLSIPGGMYAGHPEAMPSFGYRALLVTRRDVSDEAVQRLVHSVVSSLPDMRRVDPALQDLDEKKMFSESISIPFHTGVLKYLNNRKTAVTDAKTTSQ